jgi:hypothetical protein
LSTPPQLSFPPLASGAEGCSVVAARPCNSNRTHATTKEKHMECVYDEVMDAGTECFGDAWDFDTLVSLYGDVGIYLSDYDADRPLDYDAAIQEPSLAIQD